MWIHFAGLKFNEVPACLIFPNPFMTAFFLLVLHLSTCPLIFIPFIKIFLIYLFYFDDIFM